MAFLTNARTLAARTRRFPSLKGLLGLHRQRRALARLDDAALTDVGLDRGEALQEARRPVWDVPCHWVK